MTEVVLYHHVQGLTDGVRSFADELRQAGHTVHTPDMFDGRTFATIEEGMAFAGEAGFGTLARARSGRRRSGRPRRRLRGVLVRRHARPGAGTDPGRCARRPLHVGVPPGVGVRGRVARRRPGPGARQGGRPVLRGGHGRRAGACRVGRGRRALPLPGRGAPLRRLVAFRRTTTAAAKLLTERVLEFLEEAK